MRAIIHAGARGIHGLQYTQQANRYPGKGEVKVRLKAAGLNHRDLFLMNSPVDLEASFIPGSDGSGIVEAVGEGVTNVRIGAEVIINPCMGWENMNQVPIVPEILGGPTDGTLAEFVIIPQENAIEKPSYLSWEEAGVLSLSAMTAYRALFSKGNLQPGEHVIIPGIGGGVATYAAMMAAAIGAKVSVTSRSEEKLEMARKMPINQAVDSRSDWKESMGSGSVDLILDSIGPATFQKYFDVIKPNGRIVMFGSSSGDDITIPTRAIFFPQITITGTSMASDQEYKDMVDFMEKHSIHPMVDSTYFLKDTALAYERMERGEQFGNISILIREE